MKRILLTGAAGLIGTSLRNSLSNKYLFRCLDVVPVENEDDVVIADVKDFKAVMTSMIDVDAVIHLAANPGIAQSWEDVYYDGIGGTYNVFEASRKAGIKKVIYASSLAVHGSGDKQHGRLASTDTPFHPGSLYGISKATGELLARYYAEMFGMSIICIRIGSFYVNPPYPLSSKDDILGNWCSPDDLAQLVQRCLDSDGLGFQVFFGISDNKRSKWDFQNAARLVGYHPTSNAEDLISPPDKNDKRGGVLRDHALLIRAAVQEGPEAIENWQRWVGETDFEKDNLDSITYRLLPLVYHNLAGHEVDHPLMGRLKGIYRRSWVENQLSLQTVIPFINQIHDQGIPVLLLDDLTSILQLYDGQGARRLYSLDILVQPTDIHRLLDFLRGQKIWPKIKLAEKYLSVETPLEVWSPFDLPCTVAWRVTPYIKTQEQAVTIWQRADNTLVGDCPVLTLDLESHFLRCCIRAIGTRAETAVFSLIDVAWMLRTRSDTMDWGRVAELAQFNHQVLPMVKCLQEITSILEIKKARSAT